MRGIFAACWASAPSGAAWIAKATAANAASRANRMGPLFVSGVERPRRRLRLLQPEGHAHLAVHRRCCLTALLGFGRITRAPVQLAEAEVAVGDEGAHAEFLRHSEGSVVMVRGGGHIGGIALRAGLRDELG